MTGGGLLLAADIEDASRLEILSSTLGRGHEQLFAPVAEDCSTFTMLGIADSFFPSILSRP